MSDVDPFAGIGAGSLGGVNPESDGEDVTATDPTAHIVADPGADLNSVKFTEPEVLNGSLGGPDDPASDEELAELASQELDDGWGAATEEPEVPLQEESSEISSSPPVSEPDPTPSEDTAAEPSEPASGGETGTPSAPPKRQRKARQKKAEPAAAAEPAKRKKQVPIKKTYKFLAAGELDNGAPFYWVEHEEESTSIDGATTKLWRRLGKPEEMSYIVIAESNWITKSVATELVPRDPVKRVVFR